MIGNSAASTDGRSGRLGKIKKPDKSGRFRKTEPVIGGAYGVDFRHPSDCEAERSWDKPKKAGTRRVETSKSRNVKKSKLLSVKRATC